MDRKFVLTVVVMAMLLESAVFMAGIPVLAKPSVRVRGHFTKSGSYVFPHRRTAPDGRKYNNWSTKGNVNPYTGNKGTVDPLPRVTELRRNYSYGTTRTQYPHTKGLFDAVPVLPSKPGSLTAPDRPVVAPSYPPIELRKPTYQPRVDYKPFVSESGSYRGEISSFTYRPKDTYVRGYYRRDGTCVQGHYRSSSRR